METYAASGLIDHESWGNALGEFGFALERHPVTGGQVRHGKVMAGAARGLSEADCS